MSDRPKKHSMRIRDAIHHSSAEELLLRAIVRPAGARSMINAEIKRRARGEVPSVCTAGQIGADQLPPRSIAA